MKNRRTPYIYILFFFTSISGLFSQNYGLEIRTNFKGEKDYSHLTQIKKNIQSADSINKEVSHHIDQLELKGFLQVSIDSLTTTDSSSIVYLNPGPRLEIIRIYYDHIPNHILTEKQLRPHVAAVNDRYFTIPFIDIQKTMNILVNTFENDGDSFIRVSLVQIRLEENQAIGRLRLERNTERHIDKVIVKGYENFPKNFIDHELNLKIGTVFNREKIKLASRAVNNLSFVSERKGAEVLFTNDSTIIYLFLDKKKSNQFDGIVGFASKEDGDGIEFNGYLDLAINNVFNSGETIALYWKNNGGNRQRFYVAAEIPYIFNLPLTPKGNFELYRQDSTFNNIRLNLSLLYNIAGKGQFAAELSSENSNDLLDGSAAGVRSYSNLFYGLSYQYAKLSANRLFPVKFNIALTALFGTRKAETETTSQSKFMFGAHYLYSINRRNYLFIQNSSGLLNSNDYLENELFRIGGINNLRGVNEESIFSSGFSIFNFEYRFKPNETSYLYTITDFAYAENKLISENTNIISLGLGYAFKTKAGVLNLSYANGKFNDSPFSFNNSKVHVKIISNF